MAKFVVIARQAFIDLVRGLKSTAVKEGTSDLPDMIRRFKDQRGRIQNAYRKATGADIPQGKIAVPKVLFTRLKDKTGIKRMDQGAMQDAMAQAGGYAADEGGPIRRRNQMSKRGKITSREAGIWQRPDGSFGATLGGPRRSLGTREMDDMDLAYQRKLDREAAARGRKLNRTRHVTRRTLEEDEF